MKRRIALLIATAGLLAAGCHTDMWVQPKLDPQEKNDFFADSSASRLPVDGTVVRGSFQDDDVFYKGRNAGGKLVQTGPFAQAQQQLKLESYKALLLRGKERFEVYCSPCHGALGDGEGMIAKRGLKLKRPPASYHTDRLRNIPDGHIFDVITNGYGVMFSYASRVEEADRWAIVAYIRALQLSQNQPGSVLNDKESVPLPGDVAKGEGQ